MSSTSVKNFIEEVMTGDLMAIGKLGLIIVALLILLTVTYQFIRTRTFKFLLWIILGLTVFGFLKAPDTMKASFKKAVYWIEAQWHGDQGRDP